MINSDIFLLTGDSLTLAADWPLPASDDEPNLLVVSGSVVWTQPSRTALVISRYQLMPQRELNTLRQTLTTDLPTKKRREPVLSRVVLIDGDVTTQDFFSALLRPHGFLIEPVNTSDAMRIVRGGFPPVSLLVTSSKSLWSESSRDIPSILTLEPGGSPPPNDFGCPAILHQPLTQAAVQNAVESFAVANLLKHANSA